MRGAIMIAGVVGLSACSLGGADSTTAPEPPAPVPLVSRTCERELVEIDGEVVVALDPAAAKQQEIADQRKVLARPLRQLRRALRLVKRAERRLKDFNSAHPETYLAPSLYYYWRGLRDEYESAFAAYKRRVKKVRPHERAYNAVVKEGEKLWKAVDRAAKRYDAKLDGCLGPRPQIARAERDRVERLEALLEDITGDVAKRSALVECDTARTWDGREAEAKAEGDLLGYVRGGSRIAHLAPSVCYALHRARYLAWEPDLSCLGRSRDLDAPLCPPRVSDLVRATITVAHEAYHVAGETSEKRTECFGLQNAALVARRFGVAPSVADQVAWYAWHFSEAPKSYRSRQCRDGGKLDLDPSSSSFP